MIRFRLVPFLLTISVIALLQFFMFAGYTYYTELNLEQRIEEVRKEENRAQERLQKIYREKQRQRQRADSLQVLVTAYSNPDVLWTARAMYSETRRPYEMYHVGWVIRNRVEANFRSREGYKNVILDPKQFSAFNQGYPLRKFYMSLEPKYASKSETWFQAMRTSIEVLNAPEHHRPFTADTYHFYSEVSMKYGRKPDWLPYVTRVPTPRIQSKRFKFYRKTQFATKQKETQQNSQYATDN